MSEDKSFEFDAVFNEESSEKEVYRGTAGDTIQTFIYKGFNGTILLYGQTGSRELFVRCSIYFTTLQFVTQLPISNIPLMCRLWSKDKEG